MMAQDWIEVRVIAREEVSELLGMLDDPGVAGAWQEDDTLHLYWRRDQWTPDALQGLEQALQRLGEQAGHATVTIDTIPDRDWNENWAWSIKPFRVGRRVVIRPSWEEGVLAPGDIELRLDPKQAFGTGHHATTQLLVKWLEELAVGGERVLDVGTGTGILAMVAIRLGAKEAVGIDCDPMAIEYAREYAVLNHFGPELQFTVASLDTFEADEHAGFDLVLANLDLKTLAQSPDRLLQQLVPDATLLVSGLLTEQRNEIVEIFEAAGATIQAQRIQEGWIALALTSTK